MEIEISNVINATPFKPEND